MKRREFVLLFGGAITAPRDLRPEQKAVPVIGFLGISSPGPFARQLTAFRLGLADTGCVEGQNVTIEYRWAEDRYDRLPQLAADLVGRHVDVIAVSGAAQAAKQATSTIPIVFVIGGDPIVLGLVASLNQPGSNLTGFTAFSAELMAKRFDLLSELVPQAKVMAMLVNPNASNVRFMIRDVEEASRAKGVQLHILKAGVEGEFETAFASLAQLHPGALVVASDTLFLARRDELVATTARHAVPAIYQDRESVEAGGLISYGPSTTDLWREAGVYVGRILAGAKPADLPVQQPTKFELVVNLKTADALGLAIPPSILTRADEVIE